MSESGRRRHRVITDKDRYRRHKRKKVLKYIARGTIYAAILVAAVALIWLTLDMLFRPRND